jgi:hypothetical protein
LVGESDDGLEPVVLDDLAGRGPPAKVGVAATDDGAAEGHEEPATRRADRPDLKVNQTTVTVGVGEMIIESADTPWAHERFELGEYRVPTSMLEKVDV